MSGRRNWQLATGDQRELEADHNAARPCRREASEIADVIAFLASPKAAYITGAVIAADYS